MKRDLGTVPSYLWIVFALCVIYNIVELAAIVFLLAWWHNA